MPYKDYHQQLEANRRSYARNREKRIQTKRKYRDENLERTRRQRKESTERLKVGISRLDPQQAALAYDKYCRFQRCKDQRKRKHRLREIKAIAPSLNYKLASTIMAAYVGSARLRWRR